MVRLGKGRSPPLGVPWRTIALTDKTTISTPMTQTAPTCIPLGPLFLRISPGGLYPRSRACILFLSMVTLLSTCHEAQPDRHACVTAAFTPQRPWKSQRGRQRLSIVKADRDCAPVKLLQIHKLCHIHVPGCCIHQPWRKGLQVCCKVKLARTRTALSDAEMPGNRHGRLAWCLHAPWMPGTRG